MKLPNTQNEKGNLNQKKKKKQTLCLQCIKKAGSEAVSQDLSMAKLQKISFSLKMEDLMIKLIKILNQYKKADKLGHCNSLPCFQYHIPCIYYTLLGLLFYFSFFPFNQFDLSFKRPSKRESECVLIINILNITKDDCQKQKCA